MEIKIKLKNGTEKTFYIEPDINIIRIKTALYGNNFPDIAEAWDNLMFEMDYGYVNGVSSGRVIPKFMIAYKKTRVANMINHDVPMERILEELQDVANYMWISENYTIYCEMANKLLSADEPYISYNDYLKMQESQRQNDDEK